jgi:hypothetical protein
MTVAERRMDRMVDRRIARLVPHLADRERRDGRPRVGGLPRGAGVRLAPRGFHEAGACRDRFGQDRAACPRPLPLHPKLFEVELAFDRP